MRNNDISNNGARVIGVDLKLLLKENEDPNIIQKVSKLINKKPIYTIDEKIDRLLRKFYLYSNFNTIVIVDTYFWDNLPFTLKQTIEQQFHIRLHIVNSFLEVNTNLNEGLYMYVISDDTFTQNLIGNRNCITLEQFLVLTNGGY